MILLTEERALLPLDTTVPVKVYFPAGKWAQEVTEWKPICLVCMRPWVLLIELNESFGPHGRFKGDKKPHSRPPLNLFDTLGLPVDVVYLKNSGTFQAQGFLSQVRFRVYVTGLRSAGVDLGDCHALLTYPMSAPVLRNGVRFRSKF